MDSCGLPAPAELSEGRGNPDTDIAPAKRTLVCTTQRQNKRRARVCPAGPRQLCPRPRGRG